MRQIWGKGVCPPLACGVSNDLKSSNLLPSCIQLSQGRAQPDAAQLEQCTTSRAILSSFPWQLKARFDWQWLQQGELELLCWPGCSGGQPQITEKAKVPQPFPQLWQSRSSTEFHLSAGRSPICIPSLISWQKRFFLSPQMKEQGKGWVSSILLPQLMGSSYFPNEFKLFVHHQKRENNKLFKTCQHISKLLTEQLFKASWVTYKIKLSPHCGTQAE